MVYAYALGLLNLINEYSHLFLLHTQAYQQKINSAHTEEQVFRNLR